MSKKILKKFALWGREQLRSDMTKGLRESGCTFDDSTLEKCTYLWFMRIIIIRFAEVNKYIEINLKMLIGNGHLQGDKVLIEICSQLENVFPYFFQERLDGLSSIMPCNLWEKNSFVDELVNTIDIEFFNSVEILGWFHQFYNLQKHENIVGLNNGVIKSEDIAAATQLFTPKWIVQYMVDNTLGKMWLEGKGDSSTKNNLDFYIESRKKDEELQKKIINAFGRLKPEEIKFLDPTCGSGNILAYAFDVLFNIYESCGYSRNKIPYLIINNNLFGMDIDKDAIELAKTTLVFKCREKNEFFFESLKKVNVEDNIVCIKSSKGLEEFKEYLLYGVSDKQDAAIKVNRIIEDFYNAEICGSLTETGDFDESFWKERLNFITKHYGDEKFVKLKELLTAIVAQAKILNQKYHAVCTNPPYMCKKYMEKTLKNFINNRYDKYNGDLFSVFMVRNFKFALPYGLLGFMTPFVWMFINEYEELRSFILDKKNLTSLIQLEYSAYEDAIVPVCTFVLGNFSEDCAGEYFKLSDFKGYENQPVKVMQAIRYPEESYRYSCKAGFFKSIPGNPIAYWISERFQEIFNSSERLKDYIDITGSQNVTGDNLKYLKKHWELPEEYINDKWKFYSKGGDYRKWYGNMEYLIDWSENARNFYKNNKTSNLLKENYCFRRGITYNAISTRGFSAREAGEYIYDKGGPTFHLLDESLSYYILALLNSKVASEVMQLYNPTMNYQIQDVKNIPVIIPRETELKMKIDKLCKECIRISRSDWETKEISFGFSKHPVIKYAEEGQSMVEAFSKWSLEIKKRFKELKDREEELNKIFIDIYGLRGIMDNTVNDYEVTISQAGLTENAKNFISYALGCITGKYKLEGFNSAWRGPLSLSQIDDSSEDIFQKLEDFLCCVFGADKLPENLEFLASALKREHSESCQDIFRRYFKRQFFKDHCRAFKKRPIYWIFTSGKRMAFSALCFMENINCHTYHLLLNLTEKSINIKTDELRKINAIMAESKDAIFKNAALRTKKKIELDLKEINTFLNSLKENKARFDCLSLEDGIAVNYLKLQKLLCKI